MKVYVTADIEGLGGVDHWNEATIGKPGYDAAKRELSLQVAAACEGALAAGASSVLVQDAHDSGRNIDHRLLPLEASLSRGWNDDPRNMAQELDGSFSALLLIGMHAPAGSGANPLSHTFSLDNAEIRINGEACSEYLVLLYTAGYYGVPIALVSGDECVCAQAARLDPSCAIVSIKRGEGRSSLSIHPELAIRRIREAAQSSVSGRRELVPYSLPPRFEVDIRYASPSRAAKTRHYPGMKAMGDASVRFESADFFEVLRMFLFCGWGR